MARPSTSLLALAARHRCRKGCTIQSHLFIEFRSQFVKTAGHRDLVTFYGTKNVSSEKVIPFAGRGSEAPVATAVERYSTEPMIV